MGIILILLIIFFVVSLVRANKFQPPRGVEVSGMDRFKIGMAYTLDRAGMQLQWLWRYGFRYPWRERQISSADDIEFHMLVRESEWPEKFYPEPAMPETTRISETRLDAGRTYVSYHGAFESAYKPSHPEFEKIYDGYENNKWNYYRRHERRDNPDAPTCIFIHGWTGGQYLELELISPLKFLKKLGYNVVFYIHTYHGARKPVESKFSGEYWLSGDIVRSNEALMQDVYDLRTLIRIMKAKNPNARLGLWGGSGGAYLTNLTIPFEEVDFAISMVPPAALSGDVMDLPLARSMRRGFKEQGISRAKLERLWWPTTPLNFKPLLPKERLLIVAGLGDALISMSHPLKLSEHWDGARILWYPGGHGIHFGRKQMENEIGNFLKKEVLAQ